MDPLRLRCYVTQMHAAEAHTLTRYIKVISRVVGKVRIAFCGRGSRVTVAAARVIAHSVVFLAGNCRSRRCVSCGVVTVHRSGSKDGWEGHKELKEARAEGCEERGGGAQLRDEVGGRRD